MSIQIITDSTSYIPQKLREKYDIKTVALSINFSDESFTEEEVDNLYFYQKLDSSEEIPSSSQPSPKFILDTFSEALQAGKDILAIFISRKMSGTYQTALSISKKLKKEYPERKIAIIDSETNSMEMGFCVLESCKNRELGLSFEEIVEKADAMIKRSRFIFFPASLKYLKKGGRIGGAEMLLGSLLQIKPILTVNNGEADLLKKVRTSKKALKEMVDIFLQDIEEFGLGDIIVHHINCEDQAKKYADFISEKINKKVDISSIGPVIGTHVGPGALGIAYYTKRSRLD